MATSTVSLVVSVLIHVALLAVAAAVVWHTAVAPPQRRAGVLTFDEPGAAAPARGTEGTSSNAEPYRPPAPGSIRIELTDIETGSREDAPMRGLSSPADAASANGTPRLDSSVQGGGMASLLGAGTEDGTARGAHLPTAGVAEGSDAVTFAGLGASGVESVVYAVDCSGSMVTSLPIVLAELERSISKLSPTQKFGVVLFRRAGEGEVAADSFAPVLIRPTPSARKLLHEWLSKIEPSGRSSPLAGLETALAMKPDAVFLLSRSIQRSGGGVWDQGLDATMTRLEELNPIINGRGGGRRALIQTIQFLDEDSTGIMPAIGQRHGGGKGYRVIARQQDLSPGEPQ